MADRPRLPPFDAESAAKKARAAENAWNSRDPEVVALAYTPNSRWRNRNDEWHDADGAWFRSYGNENWEFDEHGFMRTRLASINDQTITVRDRLFRWNAPGPRPEDHPGLTDLGL